MNHVQRILSQVEKDRIETYLDHEEKRLPWWQSLGYALAGGVALASLEIETRWLAIAVALGAAVLVGALAGTAIRRAGAVPRLRTMPQSLRRVLFVYWIVVLVGLAAILAWAYSTDGTLAFLRAGAMYFLLIVVAGACADVRYRRIARRLAERAGLRRG